MLGRFSRIAAAGVAISFATACSGGGGATTSPKIVNVGMTPASTVRIVGVGDSLTAGVQSNGLSGANLANPLYPGTSPFPVVQATQPHGFWALLWSQANGGADPSNPALSPLPLILPPGIGSQLIPTNTGGLTSLSDPCGAQNSAAFSISTALTTRINPTTTPTDVGIPGQTLHEAITMTGPYTTGPVNTTLPSVCTGGVVQPNLIGLATLLNSESNNFYPILATFGPNVTQLQAAAALKGQIATMWLGSNDILKFALSGGQFGPTTSSAFLTDTTSAIKALQASGAKVAVANLINILDAAYFTPEPAIGPTIVFKLQGTPYASQASAIAASYVAQVNAQGVGPGGYLTLSGTSKLFAAITAAKPVALAAGDFLPDAFAAQVQALNDSYNAQIAAAVTATGATLVDMHAAVAAIKAAGGYPISAKCCTLQYGGGFFSLDGIHPSNTGYAITANAFIGAIDQGLGQSIPPLSTAQIGAIYAADPYAPH